jgi:dihydrofolate reductase
MGMTKVIASISMSLDGFVAGPNPSLEDPLGEGGELLHEWAFSALGWREQHGLEGGEQNVDSDVIEELVAGNGATIMGRKMFSGGSGGWDDDPRANGWWGDEPPFHHPVFVLTHHPREPLGMQGGTTFTFVTDGIESALDQARAVAGGKAVHVAGGGEAIQEYLRSGLLEELRLHIVPILLGTGTRLFDDHAAAPERLERLGVIDSPSGVVHANYRVAR